MLGERGVAGAGADQLAKELEGEAHVPGYRVLRFGGKWRGEGGERRGCVTGHRYCRRGGGVGRCVWGGAAPDVCTVNGNMMGCRPSAARPSMQDVCLSDGQPCGV